MCIQICICFIHDVRLSENKQRRLIRFLSLFMAITSTERPFLRRIGGSPRTAIRFTMGTKRLFVPLTSPGASLNIEMTCCCQSCKSIRSETTFATNLNEGISSSNRSKNNFQRNSSQSSKFSNGWIANSYRMGEWKVENPQKRAKSSREHPSTHGG
jgi:hypothetical protein